MVLKQISVLSFGYQHNAARDRSSGARAQQQTSCTSLLLSIDGQTDGGTDGPTPDRYIDAYRLLHGQLQWVKQPTQ